MFVFNKILYKRCSIAPAVVLLLCFLCFYSYSSQTIKIKRAYYSAWDGSVSDIIDALGVASNAYAGKKAFSQLIEKRIMPGKKRGSVLNVDKRISEICGVDRNIRGSIGYVIGQECSFVLNNEEMGADPAPGSYKRLFVEYECGTLNEGEKKATHGHAVVTEKVFSFHPIGNSKYTSFRENTTVNLRCGDGVQLQRASRQSYSKADGTRDFVTYGLPILSFVLTTWWNSSPSSQPDYTESLDSIAGNLSSIYLHMLGNGTNGTASQYHNNSNTSSP